MEQVKPSLSHNSTLKKEKEKAKKDIPLAEYSPKDKGWDRHRAMTQSMSEFLFQVQRFEKWAERMN